MSTDSSPNVTWQKMALVVAILTLALPTVGRFAWRVVYPPNYLLYETSASVQVAEDLVGEVAVVNAGHSVEKDVALYLPSRAADPASTRVEVSSARRSSLRSLFDATPKIELSKFVRESGSKIPLGTIEPEEEVRVTFIASKPKDGYRPVLSLSDARVESSIRSAPCGEPLTTVSEGALQAAMASAEATTSPVRAALVPRRSARAMS